MHSCQQKTSDLRHYIDVCTYLLAVFVTYYYALEDHPAKNAFFRSSKMRILSIIFFTNLTKILDFAIFPFPVWGVITFSPDFHVIWFRVCCQEHRVIATNIFCQKYNNMISMITYNSNLVWHHKWHHRLDWRSEDDAWKKHKTTE